MGKVVVLAGRRLIKGSTMSENNNLDPVTLGQRLAEARKDAGKTQQEVADHLGCSRPVLIAVEKGTRLAKPEEVVTLASFYGRSVHELVRPGEPAIALEPHLRAAVDTSRNDVGQVHQAVTILERFAEDYRELERLTNSPLTINYPREVGIPARGSIADFAEDIAAQERGRLLLGDQPILNLRTLLESCVGVRIFYGAMPSTIAGMYAYVPDLGYCILVNSKHPAERQRTSLSHEYGHFLSNRHRPGIDYLSPGSSKPLAERFAEMFGVCFLMPPSGVRRQFREIVDSRGDFQVADLCRLSNYYFVSVQAMTYRLEQLNLISRGVWQHLAEKGFKAATFKESLGLPMPNAEPRAPYPERYKYLAVQAFQEEKISEGQLAQFLRCDRVTAREVVEECLSRLEVDTEGNPSVFHLPFKESLLSQR